MSRGVEIRRFATVAKTGDNELDAKASEHSPAAMQYHLNGFRAGDPEITEISEPPRSEGLPDTVDVLIVGCGPTGLTLAAQLAAFPEIKTRVIEQKSGRLMLKALES
jgi:threonine dehydrogenase-like Zn-dependent dehydrogenase